jgi:hypothetical protein
MATCLEPARDHRYRSDVMLGKASICVVGLVLVTACTRPIDGGSPVAGAITTTTSTTIVTTDVPTTNTTTTLAPTTTVAPTNCSTCASTTA